MFELLIQQLIDGLTVGLIYVLLAAGLSVIFGLMNVINFAHGEMFAIGAFFAVAVVDPLGSGVGFFLALLLAPLAVGLIGIGIERYTVRPLYGRNPLYHILLTFGLVLVLNDLIYLVWGTQPRSLSRPDLITGQFDLLGVGMSRYNVFIIIVAGSVTLAVWALLRFSRYGLLIRAGAQDRQMVRTLGIDIDRYYSLVFGLGAALAALAGIIIAGRSQAVPEMGFGIIIPAFVIVVLGGLGSFRGAAVGGLLVGILQESILRPYFPALEGMVIFLIMIAVLLLRPQGLFGSEAPEGGGQLYTGTGGGLLNPDQHVKLAGAMVAVLALVPVAANMGLFSTFWVSLVIRALIWGLFALSLDFVMGYVGLVSLGHALFWAIGAYVTGFMLMFVTGSAFVALAVAVVVGAFVAWVVGYLSIRVHGVYFAMITLAFAELNYALIYRIDGWVGQTITGGSEGLFGFSAYYGIGGFGVVLDEIAVNLGVASLTGTSLFFYFAMGVLIASFLLLWRVLHSPFGTVLKAIRENEERARFIGYDTTVYKRRAFTISGAFASLAGVLFALDSGFVSPAAGQWLKSGEVIVMVILGGMGTLIGPILGSFAFFGLEEFFQHFSRRWRLFLGILFVFIIIYMPRGLISLPELLWDRIGGDSDPDADAGSTVTPPTTGDDSSVKEAD